MSTDTAKVSWCQKPTFIVLGNQGRETRVSPLATTMTTYEGGLHHTSLLLCELLAKEESGLCSGHHKLISEKNFKKERKEEEFET